MSFAAEVGLTVARELRRNLRSAKGLLSALLFLAGGAATILVYLAVRSEIVDHATGTNADAIADVARRTALSAIYRDRATADYLLGAPVTLLFLFDGMLVFVPALAILLGYDQLASELQFRTLRYTALRARRSSLVIGKALGSWISTALFSLGLCVFAWVIVIHRGEATTVATITYGARFWLMAVIFAAPYIALTSLISGAFTTPMLALLTTLGVSLAWTGVHYAAGSGALPSWLQWVHSLAPGAWDQRLLSPSPLENAIGVGAIASMAALLMLASCTALRRRDL